MGSSTQARAATKPPDVPTLRMNRAHPMADGLSATTQTPLPVVRLSGDYELTRVLGRGGMGVVYLARQSGLKRNVAYKALTHLGSIDPETLERFRSEAETLGKLQHSGIVQIFDCGTENGSPFLVMEYVPGGSLAEKVKGGRLAPREAAALVATIASAVGHAHAHGIIHRDLKPANILLTADGQPKVADFGLARDATREQLTQTGMIAGTPTYMPPEQLVGKKNLTPAVDVWAMGGLLYEMLSGIVPFSGDDPQQILTNILQHEPVSLRAWQPNLHRDLETICGKCLHKDPHRRYATGKELADDLTRFLEHRPILARPVGRWEKGVRWCRQNRAAAALTFGLAITLTAATVVSLTFAGLADEERANALTAARGEAELRQQAVQAMEAEKAARHEAERAVAAEKAARLESERAVAAEKKARQGAEAIATMMETLLASIRHEPGVDTFAKFEAELDKTAAALESSAADPLVRGRLYATLASTHIHMGHWRKGILRMEQALALRTQTLGDGDPVVRKTKKELGYFYAHEADRAADGVRLLTPVINEEVADPKTSRKEAIGLLGLLRIAVNGARDHAEEAKLCQRIMALCEQEYGPDHPETEWMRVNDCRYRLEARNFAESIPVYQKALATLCAAYPGGTTSIHWTRAQLGRQLFVAGRHRESIPYLKQTYEAQLGASGRMHPHVRGDRVFLMRAYEECRMYPEELPLRWIMLEEANASRDWMAIGEHTLKIIRGLAWTWRAALKSPSA